LVEIPSHPSRGTVTTERDENGALSPMNFLDKYTGHATIFKWILLPACCLVVGLWLGLGLGLGLVSVGCCDGAGPGLGKAGL